MARNFIPLSFVTILTMLAGAAPQAADLERGQKIFDRFCSGCHGYRGDGGDGYRGGFTPHPKMLADKAYMDALPDDYLMIVIKKGGEAVGKNSLMPGWEKRLDDEQIRDIIAHIRTF